MKNYIETDVTHSSHIEFLSNTVKESARQIVNYIYNLDAFERLEKLFINNKKTLSIKTDELGGNYLPCVFVKPNSDVYNKSDRVFGEKEYVIKINEVSEKYRLSTQWISSDINSKVAKVNYLRALITIVNKYYADILKIYEESEKVYLKSLL